MTLIVDDIDTLPRHAGVDLGATDWFQVSQAQVDAFAAVTRSPPEGGPGSTAVHGYLILALSPRIVGELLRVKHFRLGLNYGINALRFLTPVPIDASVRARGRLGPVDPVPGEGVQAQLELTFEVDGATGPACVAELLYRFYR